MLDAKNKTRFQEDFNHLGPKDALVVFSTASPAEQADIRTMLQSKTTSEKLSKLEPEEAADIRARMRKLGIRELTTAQLPPKPVKPVKPVRQVYVAP